MNNPVKLSALGTQDENKQNKDIAQYVLDTIINKQTQITQKLLKQGYVAPRLKAPLQ